MRLADASIRLDSMPAAGRDLAVVPSESERQDIAARLGLTAVDSLSVKLHAVKFRGGMRVTGQLEAGITQPSVVSLEPVTQQIAEPIDRIFLPGAEKPFAEAANAEIFVDLHGDDVPDHFAGPEADLSDLIVETLALAVDPYPRAPGESLDDLQLPSEAVEDHPFSALKALKPRDG
jgi:hypothetical protein